MTQQPDTDTRTTYSFDNDDPEAVDRHNYLSAILDPGTFAHISALGDLTGRRCLEVGAGGGNVVRWLAQQVGPTGQVVATDLNPRHIPTGDGYTVLKHNIVSDPMPEGQWDIIHARMVLLHIPERREVLARLAAALAPGGALVIEEWMACLGKLVLAAPDAEAEALIDTYQEIMMGKILPRNGNDSAWAGKVHAAMLAEGLVDVHTAIHAQSWPGGTPGALLIGANIGQLRSEFLAEGFTEAQLDRMYELIKDPRLVLRGHFTYSTVGRRAAVPR